MKDYHINIFDSDEDECYIADIPDLKFCSACGDTPEAALREAQTAKTAWLAAAAARFDVFVTTDRNLKNQRMTSGRTVPIGAVALELRQPVASAATGQRGRASDS